LCRTYGAQFVAVLDPGLPAWAISGVGPPGLDWHIHIHLALRLPETQSAALKGICGMLVRKPFGQLLCRTYGAQFVAVLDPGLPAWAISGAGPPGLDSHIRIHLALRFLKTSQLL
jgi:hypothetical protein